MPRQSNSSSASHRSLPPPKLWHQAPPMYSSPTAPLQVQSKTGLLQSVKEGVGLGIGSSIGHSIARSFGFGSPTPPTYSPPTSTYSARAEYTQCLEANKGSPQVCTPFLSKEKSTWTECMELNGYQAHTCSGTQ